MAHHEDSAVTEDGVSIHFEIHGAGNNDVVFVHGLTDCSATWGPIVGVLASTHRVITLDLRGHGQSGDSTDYKSAGMARDVSAVVAAARIVNPLVIGHSLGGIVATAYAATAQVRGVINVDQPLQLSAFQEGLRQVEPMLRDPASFPGMLAAIFGSMDGPVLSDGIKSEIASHRRPRQEVVLGVWGQVLDTSVDELDAQIHLIAGAISAPYLSLEFVEANDAYASWLRAVLPQALVENWPGLGHYGHRTEPERFVARILDFDPLRQ